MSHAIITNEMVARARSRIGAEWQRKEPYYNTVATKDTIRHFVHGIGDTNPLWTEEEYAKKTRYSCIISPPCFLYSVHWPLGQGGGMPGIHGWHAGNDWEFYRPIYVGDEFTVTETLTDLAEKKSQMSERAFIAYGITTYKNQRGEIVARAKGWSVWAERGASGEKGKYLKTQKATYTKEELKSIEMDYDREEIRGSRPRYWEDVEVGEKLTPVIKGPLSMRDIYAWLMGAGSPYIRAHGIELSYRRKHPAIGMVDRTTGQVDIPELVHMEESRAREIGLPSAYDYGSQRISWLGHLMTNWIGDDGFMKRLYAELRLFNYVGDTIWCEGKVVGKSMENGECLVDCDIWCKNQRGEITAPGKATVILPSKVHGPVKFPAKETLT